MHGVPRDLFDPSNGRLVQTLDAESRDLSKGGTPVLESIIRCPVGRAEGFPTSLALVPTTLSPPRRAAAVANDGWEVTFSRSKAVLLRTVEALHGWCILETQELMVSNSVSNYTVAVSYGGTTNTR